MTATPPKPQPAWPVAKKTACACTPACSECVVDTLEGPGVVKSECPACGKPAWKNDLERNHTYGALVEHVRGMERLFAGERGWCLGVQAVALGLICRQAGRHACSQQAP